MARIEDYALIGDCRTAALVSREGSIDWYCCPRFDSEACFAALLGTPEHGRWLIGPQAPARITRRYRPKTLVLETHFETEEGAAALIDFMPLDGHHSTIVRLVRGTRGRVLMHTELILRFGYGAIVPWVTRLEDGGLRAIAGPDMMVLRTPVQLRGVGMTTVGKFVIYKDETIPFVLSYYPSHKPLHVSLDPRIEQTVTAIERRLLRDGFVMRYDTAIDHDGLPRGRGAQRSRPSQRGIRPASQASGRQFSASLFAHGAGQRRVQSDAARQAGRAARTAAIRGGGKGGGVERTRPNTKK
jgi:GH15 family glucan-1,4-alpha-glucosidase